MTLTEYAVPTTYMPGGKQLWEEKMVSSYSIVPRETLMIGDTLHDAEVANALGFDVRLYVGGHSSERRLREVAPVLLSAWRR